MRYRLFFIITVVLFGFSLFLPGIVYQPSVEDNPKYPFCVHAANPSQWQCTGEIAKDYSCSRIDLDLKSQNHDSRPVISQEAIREYCGNNWDEPRAHVMPGYFILAFGWAGVLFLGNFAWLGNLFYIGLLIALWRKEYKAIFYLGIIATVFALMAFNLSEVPRNEGGVNNYQVDYLGIGYYIWLGTMVTSVLYGYIQWKKRYRTTFISPVKAVLFFGVMMLVFFLPSFIGSHPQYFTRYLPKGASKEAPPVQNNLIQIFRETIATKNYRVTIQENNNRFYLEKGIVVVVGDQTTQQSFIIKNGNLFIVDNVNKTFRELPLGSDTAKNGLEDMGKASLLKDIMRFGQIASVRWKQEGNKQIDDSVEHKIVFTFDPDTHLLTTYSIDKKDSDQPSTLVNFDYEEITDDVMASVKMFPKDYRRIE